MRLIVIIFLFIICSFRSRAACPAPESLYHQLETIKNNSSVEKQETALKSWMTQWEKCYSKADSIYVDALLISGLNYYKANKIEKSIQSHEQIIQIYQENKGLRLKLSNLSKTYYRLGIFYSKIQKLNESIEALQQTISVSGNNPKLKTWVNQAHLYLIYNYYVQGDFQRALQHAFAAEVLSAELNDDIVLSKVLQQKAQVLHMLKQLPEALAAIDKAIPLIVHSSHQQNSASSQYMLRGNILRDMQQNKEALKSLETAYSIAKKNKETYISDFPMAIGYFYQTTNQPELALNNYNLALTSDDGSHNKCLIYNNIANIYKHQKKFEESLAYLQKGIHTIIPDFKDTTYIGLPAARTIRTMQQKDFLLGLIRDKAETWMEYAKNQNNHHPYLQRSLNAYMLADSMIDFMRWEHTGNNSKLYWREKTFEMYEQAIEASFLLKDPLKAFYFFEKSRAVLLNDKINSLGAGQQLNIIDQQQEKNIRQQITELQFKLAGKGKNTHEYVQLLDQLLKAEESQKQFIQSLETRSPTYYSYRYNNQVPTIEDVRLQLLQPMGDNAVYLSFFSGENSIYAIGIKNNHTHFFNFNKTQHDSLLNEVKLFLPDKSKQNKSYKEYWQVSSSLYKLLIEPFGLSENDRIIISTNSDFFPFEALNRSAERMDYLGQHHAISYSYSAGILLKKQTKKQKRSSGKSFLGIAPVNFSEQLGQTPLIGSDNATESIESNFMFSKILTHNQATRNAFLREAPQYNMVQLLTHAIADSVHSEPTLYFADSTLLLSEIDQMGNFQTQLMVLSACQTGIGKNQTGEGIYSLARGFASAGIPSVVTTLWSVENKPVYELTKLFFENIKMGDPLDIALQKARNQWLNETSGADQLPYTWAGIVLVGDTDPIITQNKIGWWIAGFLLCLSLFLVIGYFKR